MRGDTHTDAREEQSCYRILNANYVSATVSLKGL